MTAETPRACEFRDEGCKRLGRYVVRVTLEDGTRAYWLLCEGHHAAKHRSQRELEGKPRWEVIYQ